jgi:hypothetical protein
MGLKIESLANVSYFWCQSFQEINAIYIFGKNIFTSRQNRLLNCRSLLKLSDLMSLAKL